MNHSSDRRGVALVTGTSGGIGGAIALHLARQGWDLALFDQTAPPPALLDKLDEHGTHIHAVTADLCDEAAIPGAVEQCLERLGPVDCLVNNAGLTAQIAPLEKITSDAWQQELTVNLSAPLRLIQAVIPSMRQRQWGRIVNISSMAARGGLYQQTGYAATKTGLLGLTRNVALECARDGITCNAILPGLVETPAVRNMPPLIMNDTVSLVPARRLGKPDEIAALAGFLCSNEAGFINGAEIDIDGGARLCPVVLGSQRAIAERHALASGGISPSDA